MNSPTFTSREIRLASRPDGSPTLDNFELASASVVPPGDGELLVRNHWMSVDPYMRGRMNDVRSYVPPFEVGKALQGGAIGEVIESRSDRFEPGDFVNSFFGWREYATLPAEHATKVDVDLAPPQAYLDVLGMTGMTAYVGLNEVAHVQEGERVFISAAAGAVGSIAGQIAKLKGCYVAGSAGSDEKVSYLIDELGFDAAFNYKTSGDIGQSVREVMPKGIDVYFENVGGDHLQAALGAMRRNGRIAVCGMIAHYNDKTPRPGPTNLMSVIANRLTIRGFLVQDHLDQTDKFIADMGGWLEAGKIKSKETVVEGIENAPQAFLDLLAGNKLGKMLVRLA